MRPEKNNSMSYRADIDGLRAVAVLLVMLFHLDFGVPGGYIGVDVFFVISGYLITGIITKQLDDSRFSLIEFYSRRARRILPALVVVLACTTVAACLILLPTDLERYSKSLVAAILSVSNFWFWSQGGYFGPASGMEPLLHTWSLGVEEQFYLCLPISLLLFHRWWPKRVPMFLLVVSVISFIATLYFAPIRGTAVFYLSPFRAWELVMGGMLSVMKFPVVRNHFARNIFGLSALMLVLIPAWIFDSETSVPWMLLPCLGAATIIWIGGSGDAISRKFLTWRPVVLIGLISYSLYLWHWPIVVLAKHAAGDLGVFTRVCLGLLTLGLAAATWRFIEMPFRDKRRVKTGRFAACTASALVVLVSFSAYAVVADGVPARFDAKVVRLDKDRIRNVVRPECINYRGKKIDDASACRIGASVRPTILVWGDSYAHAMLPAFSVALEKEGKAALFVSESGCPPLPSARISYAGRDNWRCREFNSRIMKWIGSRQPFEAIVISAAWDAYLSDISGYKLSAHHNTNPTVVLTNELSSLATSITRISDKTKILVLTQTPAYRSSVPLAMIKSHLGSEPFDEMTSAEWDSESSKSRSSFRAASSHQNIEIIDTAEWFCAQGACKYSNSEGEPYYYDHGHLNERGAGFVAPHIKDALDAALGSEVREVSKGVLGRSPSFTKEKDEKFTP